MTAREVIKLLVANGWYAAGQTGSHQHFKHQLQAGKVTVPVHAGRDLKPGTLNQILKKAGLK
jgi:predicted RNA binding protein YcfA (HicA-like mRNA interferase family)